MKEFHDTRVVVKRGKGLEVAGLPLPKAQALGVEFDGLAHGRRLHG
jgi:hypothetical protein